MEAFIISLTTDIPRLWHGLLSVAHQTDINTASSEKSCPIPGLWLVQPSQYWPLIGWHWPQSDPCHWYQGPVSLHNGGCDHWGVTSYNHQRDNQHLLSIEDYSDHWASGAAQINITDITLQSLGVLSLCFNCLGLTFWGESSSGCHV